MSETNGSTPAMDEDLAMMYADRSSGLEGVTMQDLQVPFLAILQPLSPQVNKRNSEYVQGAEPGDIYNIATQEIYKTIDFVPSLYMRRYTEWKPRESGGGLVRDWGTDESRLLACKRDPNTNRDITPDGNVLVTSGTFFGILSPMGERAVLAFSSTQLKKARRWLANAMNQVEVTPEGEKFTLPLFSTTYQLTTVAEKNDKGEWFGWKITPLDRTLKLSGGKNLYLDARKMKEDVVHERIQLAPPPQLNEVQKDEEIPF